MLTFPEMDNVQVLQHWKKGDPWELHRHQASIDFHLQAGDGRWFPPNRGNCDGIEVCREPLRESPLWAALGWARYCSHVIRAFSCAPCPSKWMDWASASAWRVTQVVLWIPATAYPKVAVAAAQIPVSIPLRIRPDNAASSPLWSPYFPVQVNCGPPGQSTQLIYGWFLSVSLLIIRGIPIMFCLMLNFDVWVD